MSSPSGKILTFGGLFALGSMILYGAIALISSSAGMPITEFQETLSESPANLSGGIIRALVWIQTICLFVLPAVLFGIWHYRKAFWSYFELNKAPTLLMLFLGIVFLLTGYPIVQLSFEVNSMVPMPEWASQMEGNAAEMLDELLRMESIAGFITTFTILALLPAIGEELFFRGVLQKQLEDLFKSGHMAVWVSAIIFSAIHFQFEGFLPRLVLGAILGYLYMWTRNLWVPIAAHLFNNGIQVAMLYFADIDLQQAQDQEAVSIGPLGTIVSIALFITTAFLINKATRDGHA